MDVICNGDYSGFGNACVGDYVIVTCVRENDRARHFDPALGGDPVLFQHFFWFYKMDILL